ncbi:hypothetical protein Acy02nite_90190 [Actinoplanes cyaneus]|uniref:Lipoprotein n=1 Tax=Actinoplanes cyaneus TaxID=52696 RepID=A0A919MB24_9ACTN|nr:hypothetical protein [Actinoplanes cyaneus]MCW2144380.1 hypothetical protein [Actinoplanes cyaneus]GID71138.1 hypothetical protein Acy02nite_90190 [Actinoplanes cyaneus]
MRAAVAATAMLLLAGCAHDTATPAENDLTDLPAATVVDRSLAAFKSAPSYHVEVHGGDASKPLSIKLAVRGENLSGSLTRDGGTTEILKTATNFYIRPDETFWATELGKPEQAHTYATFAGARWIKVEHSDPLLATAGLDGTFSFADRTFLDSAVPKQLALGDPKDIGGVPTITVLDTRTTKAARTEISVATTGEPYPVRWDFGLGTVADFTAYETPSDPIEDPAPNAMVDMKTVLRHT